MLIQYFRFCNYKTSRVKNLLIHLEAIHPGVSKSGIFDSTTTAPAPNQAPTIAVPPQVRIVIRISGDFVNPFLFQSAFPTHAVSGIDHFLSSASAVSANCSTPAVLQSTSPIAQQNIQVLTPQSQHQVSVAVLQLRITKKWFRG